MDQGLDLLTRVEGLWIDGCDRADVLDLRGTELKHGCSIDHQRASEHCARRS